MLYTTLSSLKTKLGIATTDSDTELSLIIERATELIDLELGFNLEERIITERIDGNGNNRLYLKNKPNSIISIKTKDGYNSYTLDYIDGYILHLEECIIKGIKNIIVEYNVGYDSLNIPADIQEICLDICCIIADKQNIKGSNSSKLIDKNIQTQKLGNLSITYFGDKERVLNSFEKLNPSLNIEKVLNKYKSFSGLH